MLKMKLIASVMIIVLATALIGGLTGAWFTDVDDAGTATFTAGTLTVDVSDGLNIYNPILSTPVDMEPGDVFDPIIIEIKNTGSKNLAWFGNWTFTPKGQKPDLLLDKLYIKTMSMQFFKADGTTFYAEDVFIENGTSTAYSSLLGPDGIITLRDWNDNPLMAPGTVYENMGALKPNCKYIITVEFGFHESANSDYQGNKVAPIKIGFEVDATQVDEDALNALNNSVYPLLGTHHIGWLEDQIAVQ